MTRVYHNHYTNARLTPLVGVDWTQPCGELDARHVAMCLAEGGFPTAVSSASETVWIDAAGDLWRRGRAA